MTFIMLSCSDPTHPILQFHLECCERFTALLATPRLWLVFCRLSTSVQHSSSHLCFLVSRACNLDMAAVASSSASITILALGSLVNSYTIRSAYLVADPCGAFRSSATSVCIAFSCCARYVYFSSVVTMLRVDLVTKRFDMCA